MNKMICYVKIIVNPQVSRSFSLKFNSQLGKGAYLKIMIPDQSEFSLIIDEIKKAVSIKYNFEIQYNWKNIPSSIRENKEAQINLLKIFNSTNDKYYNISDLIQTHIKKYGAAPDLKYINEKNKIKLRNYVKNIPGVPYLTIEDISIIIEILNSK